MKQSDCIVLEKQLHHLPLVHKTLLKLVCPEESGEGCVPCENTQMNGKCGLYAMQKSQIHEFVS